MVTTEAEEENDSEDEVLPSARPLVPSPRPQIQSSTSKSAISATEDDEEESPNDIKVPRKSVPAPLPRRPTVGTKTPPAKPRKVVPTGNKLSLSII